jgi:hypothetical protein
MFGILYQGCFSNELKARAPHAKNTLLVDPRYEWLSRQHKSQLSQCQELESAGVLFGDFPNRLNDLCQFSVVCWFDLIQIARK